MSDQIALFSYGTLQDPKVQLATYHRRIEGVSDALTGYLLVNLVIEDPYIISVSGKDVHTIARRTGNPEDRIAGTVLLLTSDELVSSDDYEADGYARTEVTLESGRKAFVYVEEAGLTD